MNNEELINLAMKARKNAKSPTKYYVGVAIKTKSGKIYTGCNLGSENGLYNILSQSRKPIARKWRRIIHNEIIRLRKANAMDILQQFDRWDDELDTLYVDPETGILMQSVTVQGGDVEQVPYEPK